MREPLAQPYTQHGKTIRDDVRELIWSQGNLPDAFYDEFVFQAKLTAQPGTLYFTVTQQCGTEQLRWDATTPDARYPAPAFKVLPKMPSGDATHTH